MADNNPLICSECGGFYLKCFSCGYVYCGCEGTDDNCPECDSTDIGFADIEDLLECGIFDKEDEIWNEGFEDTEEDENIN